MVKVTMQLRSVGGQADAVLRTWLLGGFRISVGERTVPENAWRLKKAASLVKLLALSPNHRLHREQAMEVLWPHLGRRAASNNLRQALHAARRALDPSSSAGSPYYLASEDEQLALCSKGCELWVDVEAFEEAVATARRSRDPAAYRAAIELYLGELLPADRYEEWAEGRRQELRRTFLSLLMELAGLYEERGEYERGVEVLQRVVEEEPTLEEAHAGLMRLNALLGREGEALAQYERLRGILSRELGAEPSTATRRLREEIAVGRLVLSRPVGHPPEEPPDSRKHNLPALRSSFVGRERELVELKRALAMTRLLTLTGAGGSGKTRLALEVARDLLGVYPDGVWFVELARLSESSLVPQALATSLGVKEQPGQSLTYTLTKSLRNKNLLVILDNCEHLIEAAARLADTLLDRCPRLRILATSREALDVLGEIIWLVPPLSTADSRHPLTAGELEGYEAARLFSERARQRDPYFALTPSNARAVAEVCHKLDGIPLALELAAARVGALAVDEIASRVENSLGLLTNGARTAVPRQRTLKGALEWSHDLLSEPERILFRRLSTFSGGWTLGAAEVVGAGDGIDQRDVLELLSRLLEKSLVVIQATGDGGLRYGMLEPVRQYGKEKLEHSEEAAAIKRRHAEVYLALAEEAKPELRGASQQATWLERLEIEYENLRAALGWLLDDGEAELAVRMSIPLWLFWETYGRLSEGRRWLERAISLSRRTTSPSRAWTLLGAGWIAFWQADYEAAKALFEESLAVYRELGNKEGIVTTLTYRGLLAVLAEQDLASASASLEEAIKLRPEINDRRTLAYLLIFEGLVAASLGDPERTVELHEQSLALFRQTGDVRGISRSLISLGIEELNRANYVRATALLQELLNLSRQTHDKVAIHYAFAGLAGVSASQGQPVRATRLWATADAVREASGIQPPPFIDSYTKQEAQLVVISAELGAVAFERAWAEGRAMTLEDAVEYALAQEEKEAPARTLVHENSSTGEPSMPLTRREWEIVTLLARGLTNRQIAKELSISLHTVENHVARILKKLKVRSREQVVVGVSMAQRRRSHPL